MKQPSSCSSSPSLADPNFAAAYAELARAYTIKARYFVPAAQQKQLNEDAEVDVDKALAIDPNLAEVILPVV